MALRNIFRTGPLENTRVEAFSDGVFAVAITLLVLEIKLPAGLATETDLWRAFAHLLPVLAAWLVSFVFILVFWVNHNYFFASLQRGDRGLLWLNGLVLICISLIPFPTGLVGEYPGMTPPLALLSFVMMLTALSFSAMRYYATFNGHLLKVGLAPKTARTALLQSMIAPTLYLSALVLSFFWPLGTILVQIAVPVIFFLRSPDFRHHEKSETSSEQPT